MKKYMKKIVLMTMIVISAIGFNSCSDDGYSLGDFAMSWATVLDEKGNSFQLDGEKHEKLWVGARETNYVPKNKRVIINYTLLSDNFEGYDHAIKLNSYVADVLTKNITYPDLNKEENNTGKAPIGIDEIWEGGNYLNLTVTFQTATSSSLHYFDMEGSNAQTGIEEDGVIELELKHRIEGTIGSYVSKTYVSFNLSSLRLPEGLSSKDKVTLRIKSPGIDGVAKTHEIEYKLPTVAQPEEPMIESDSSSQFR